MKGIYLTPPHGELFANGTKKAIVKSQDIEPYFWEKLVVVSGDLAYGIITISQGVRISLDDFNKLFELHRVREKERNQWWEHRDTLFLYRFNIIELFDVPRKVNVPRGTKLFIENVEFVDDDAEDITDLSADSLKEISSKKILFKHLILRTLWDEKDRIGNMDLKKLSESYSKVLEEMKARELAYEPIKEFLVLSEEQD